jgi:hypothetical protein
MRKNRRVSDAGKRSRPRPGWSAWLASGLATLAILGASVALQPPAVRWWYGGDYAAVYLRSGLSLFGGHRSGFIEHPGLPVQSAVAVGLTARWAVSSAGDSREERMVSWFERPNGALGTLRTVALIMFALSVLIVFGVVGRLFGDPLWGMVGSALFIAAPALPTTATVPAPGPLLGATSLATTGLLACAWRGRTPVALFAGAFLLGFAVSVKLHAIALLVPLALVVVARTPAADWPAVTRAALRRRTRVAT